MSGSQHKAHLTRFSFGGIEFMLKPSDMQVLRDMRQRDGGVLPKNEALKWLLNHAKRA